MRSYRISSRFFPHSLAFLIFDQDMPAARSGREQPPRQCTACLTAALAPLASHCHGACNYPTSTSHPPHQYFPAGVARRLFIRRSSLCSSPVFSAALLRFPQAENLRQWPLACLGIPQCFALRRCWRHAPTPNGSLIPLRGSRSPFSLVALDNRQRSRHA
jgi:hypothetical protein